MEWKLIFVAVLRMERNSRKESLGTLKLAIEDQALESITPGSQNAQMLTLRQLTARVQIAEKDDYTSNLDT